MASRAPSHLISVFMLGTVSQIGQVLLIRELLMVFHGSELAIGIIFAAWLIWVGAGSRLGAGLVDTARDPVLILLVSASGILLVLPATILAVRGLRGLFDVLPGAYLSIPDMIVGCFLVMAPACLLLGLQFVVLSRIWREIDRTLDTSSAEKTYAGEAAGNVAGGVLFTFLLVHHLNSIQSAVAVSMLMLGTVWVLTWKPVSSGRTLAVRVRPLCLGLLALAALAFPFLEQVDTWAYRIAWRTLAPQHDLIAVHQSKHGAISVLKREDQYSFFQSGHLMFSIAGLDTPAPGLEDQEAITFAHFSMVQHTRPQRILLIGGGMRGMLSEIVRYPVTRVDYVELDEVLTRAAMPYLSPATLDALADSRVRMIHEDGRLFVKSATETYDMIIVDAPDPATAVLNRYYTREFFREARALLEPDGVLAIGCTSTPDLMGTAVANRNTAVYHTLDSVFDHVLPAGDRFMFYFASNAGGQASLDAPTLQTRFASYAIEAEGFSHHHFWNLLQESQLRRVNWIVRNHGRTGDAHLAGPGPVPIHPGAIEEQMQTERQLPPVNAHYFINSDFKPILYYYTLWFWSNLTRTGHGEAFKQLLRVRLWWMPLLFSLFLLAAVALRAGASRIGRSHGLRFAVLFAVFTTGLSTMALQIALLFSFQSMYGFVYEVVGLIVAVFMSGLALGALLVHRHVPNRANIHTLAGVQLLIAVVAGLIAVALPSAATVQSPVALFLAFSTLTFVSGLINGVGFPMSTACYMALINRADRTTGIVYGVELLGAGVGATLASVVVAPVLGIVACCLLASVANGTALLVLLISGRSYSCLTETGPTTQ